MRILRSALLWEYEPWARPYNERSLEAYSITVSFSVSLRNVISPEVILVQNGPNRFYLIPLINAKIREK